MRVGSSRRPDTSLKVHHRSARRRQARGPKRLKRLGVVSERHQAPLLSAAPTATASASVAASPAAASLLNLLRVHDPAAAAVTSASAPAAATARHDHQQPSSNPSGGTFSTTRINGSYWIVFNACCAQLVATGFSYNVESLPAGSPASAFTGSDHRQHTTPPTPPPSPPEPDNCPTYDAYDAYDGDQEEATDIEDVADDCMSCMTVLVSPPSSPLKSLVPHMRRCGDSDSDSSLSHNAAAIAAAAAAASAAAAAGLRSAGNVAPVLTTQRGGPVAGATRFVDTGIIHVFSFFFF